MEIISLLFALICVYALYIFAKIINKKYKQNAQNVAKADDFKISTVDYTKCQYSHYKLKPILTKNEYLFYIELKKITDKENLVIFPKVGLKDLFEITAKKDYMSWFGKIAQKHVDFVILDSLLKYKFAIELDDNSHVNKGESDQFKDYLFRMNDMELIRIKARYSYSNEDILKSIGHRLPNNTNAL